jgi:hypothetical protein
MRGTQSFQAVVESFHAAVVIMKGGERSWISAAVSLSMTSIDFAAQLRRTSTPDLPSIEFA